MRTRIETGGPFTLAGYEGAWVQEEFWRAALNTLIVVVFTVIISLTFGTLGGYALARSGYRYSFWILMLALVFRAMPHITLVSGYLLPFFEWNLWGHLPTAIIVLVAINQPFTLWMLHSFFLNIPKDLDESAMVDGCTRFQAFRHVIIPVMWPGVITTGLFSFLLAYNDFAVTAMLLSRDNMTMVPKIASFLGSTQVQGNVMFAVAAVVSATVPLFLLIVFFQRQIVSGPDGGGGEGLMDPQAAKALVREHQAALAGATPESVAGILARHTAPDWHWRGMHPFHERHGPEAVAAAFWSPFLAAMRRVQRRPDIFFAGLNTVDGFASTWVVSAGHLMALFDAPFLGIPPTGRIAMLRYAEFHRVRRRADRRDGAVLRPVAPDAAGGAGALAGAGRRASGAARADDA